MEDEEKSGSPKIPTSSEIRLTRLIRRLVPFPKNENCKGTRDRYTEEHLYVYVCGATI